MVIRLTIDVIPSTLIEPIAATMIASPAIQIALAEAIDRLQRKIGPMGSVSHATIVIVPDSAPDTNADPCADGVTH